MSKGYKPPKWFTRIPLGSHGSTPAQKRLWWVVSRKVRQDDWKEWPYCRACEFPIEDWTKAQAGHFKRYSICHSWFKFEPKNITLIHAGCNTRDDGADYYRIGEHLIAKYGKNHLKWIEEENKKYSGQKMQEWEIVDKVADLAPHLVDFDV